MTLKVTDNQYVGSFSDSWASLSLSLSLIPV